MADRANKPESSAREMRMERRFLSVLLLFFMTNISGQPMPVQDKTEESVVDDSRWQMARHIVRDALECKGSVQTGRKPEALAYLPDRFMPPRNFRVFGLEIRNIALDWQGGVFQAVVAAPYEVVYAQIGNNSRIALSRGDKPSLTLLKCS
jgi:hypothetical protein